MKVCISSIIAIMIIVSRGAFGQGFIYDQQSGTDVSQIEGGVGASVGVQSFTPTLSSVGFFQVYVSSSSGGDLRIDLISDGLSGPLLGSSQTATFQGPYFGVVDFVFPTSVSVTPDVKYYFQPVSLTGSWSWGLLASFYATYPGGTAFFNGSPSTSNDFWFREGIIVPEPSAALLTMFGAGIWMWMHRKNIVRS
jgi:hypothetical protein